MTTYTVYADDPCAAVSGLSVTEAADMVLRHDGYRYEIRANGHAVKDEQQWVIYTSDASEALTRGARHMHSTVLSVGTVYAKTADDAWPLLAERVLSVCHNWRRAPAVMTDADYEAMLAEFAADEAEA